MKKIKFSLIFAAGLILLASCNNLFELPGSDQPPAGYGRVIVNTTAGETSRTTFPAKDIFNLTYTFTKDGVSNTQSPDTTGGTTFTLEYGSYTVKVDASIKNGSADVVASGTSISFTVSSSSSSPEIIVDLSPVTTTGSGTFEYAITYPGSTSLEILSMTEWPSGTINVLGTLSQVSGTGEKTKTGTINDLPAASYVLIIKIKDTEGNYASFVTAVHIYPFITTKFTHKFVDTDMITLATSGITLHKSGETAELSEHTFNAVNNLSYTATDLTPLTVTVKNSGNQETGALTVTIDYTTKFDLSKNSITSINVNASDSFTVTPKTGLSAGTHTASVTVSDGNGISESFSVSFTVNDPTIQSWDITLTPSGIFTGMTYNPTPLPSLSVVVKNTGNQATGALTVSCDSTNFTTSTTSISSLTTLNEEAAPFTVTPIQKLDVGNYTATITVKDDGTHSLEKTIDVSFTVTAKDITSSSITITGIVDKTYTGSSITQDNITVKDGSDTLTKDTHYTVTYKNNTEPTDIAKVVISGKGNYSGSIEKDFAIKAPFALADSGNNPLTSTSTISFTADAGYTTLPAAQSITITNTGTEATGALTITLDATNANDQFQLSKTSITTIAKDASDTFTIQPKLSLAAGTYNTTVTVKNTDDVYFITFNVTFTVSNIAVTLNTVAAKEATTATTQNLTLTFSAAISGLTAASITITDTDTTGATKGTISDTGPSATWDLPITGVTKGGKVSVAVADFGNYTISGSPKDNVQIYFTGGSTETVQITFDSNGGNSVDPLTIDKGTTMGTQFPTAPTKTGYEFDGWWDTTGNNFIEYLSDTPVSANVTVTAKWVSAYTTDGNYEVPLTGVKVKNTDQFEAANNSGMWIPLTFPNDFDIGKYDAFTAVIRAYDSTGARISSLTWGDTRFGFTMSTVTPGTVVITSPDIGDTTGSVWYNYGANTTIGTNQSFRADGGSPLNYTPKAFAFMADGNGFRVKYMALESLSFRRRATADTPIITTQPVPQVYTSGGTINPLTVEANVIDGGALSYQWYNASASIGGTTTEVSGATNATFTPPINSTTDHGDKFYYVVVTNTNNKATTTSTASTNSTRVKITDVVPPPDLDVVFADGDIKEHNVEDVTMIGTSPNYTGFSVKTTEGYAWAWAYFKVKFPDGFKLSDYTKLEYTIKATPPASGTDVGGYKAGYMVVYASESDVPTGGDLSTESDNYIFTETPDASTTGIQNLNEDNKRTVTIRVPTGTDLNEVWIAFATGGSDGFVWELKNIKFFNP